MRSKITAMLSGLRSCTICHYTNPTKNTLKTPAAEEAVWHTGGRSGFVLEPSLAGSRLYLVRCAFGETPRLSFLIFHTGTVVFTSCFRFTNLLVVRSFRVSVVTLLPRKTQHRAVLSKVTGLGRGKDCGDLCILFLIVNV